MNTDQCLSNPLNFVEQDTVDLFYLMGGRNIRDMLKLLVKKSESYRDDQSSFSEARMIKSFITMTHMLLRPGHHKFSRHRLPPHVYLRVNGTLVRDKMPYGFDQCFINLIYNFNRFQIINYKFKIRKLSHNLAYFDHVIFNLNIKLDDHDCLLFDFINSFYFQSCVKNLIPRPSMKFFYCKEEHKFYFGDMFVKFYDTLPSYARPVFGVVHKGVPYIILLDGCLVREDELSKGQLSSIKNQARYAAQLDIFMLEKLSKLECVDCPYLDIKNIEALIK